MKWISAVIILFLVAMMISFGLEVKAQAPPRGVVTIAFDDGKQNQYDNAFPLLKERGMPATFYIITDNISDFSGDNSFMSIAELQNLQGNGSEIGSHSVTHPVFTSLTDDQIIAECSNSKQLLQSYGLKVNNFAYPYGMTNDHVDSIVYQYYRSARTAYVGPYLMSLPTSQFSLPGYAAESGNTNLYSQYDCLQWAEGEVDQAVSTNSWVIIFFHNIIPNDTTDNFTIDTNYFASFLDYVQASGAQVLTVNQALDLAGPSPSASISPPSVNIPIGGSQLFSSAVLGGFSPYFYQWNLNGTAVPGATSSTWTFTPVQSGQYSVYLNVTDDLNNTVLSNIVNDIRVYNQYPLTMSTNYGTFSPSSGGYAAGSTFSISATPPVAAAGERYVWLGWTGSGVGSYTGMNNPAQITLNGAITETAQWEHQYYVTFGVSGLSSDASGTVATVGGSAKTFSDLPFSLWVDSGSSVNFGYVGTVQSNAAGKQFVLTGVTASSPFVVTGSTTVIGSYKAQYYLAVSSAYGAVSGGGWYDFGSSAYASVNSLTAAGASGTQYVFTNWSGDATGTASPSNPIIMNGAKTATADWKTQFQLTVTSAYGSPTGQGWYDTGSMASFGAITPVSGGSGKQYVFVSWTGSGTGSYNGTNNLGSIVMNNPISETAQWKTQYYLTFTQSGVASDFSGTVITVNGTAYDRSGIAFWANPGDVYMFSYVSPLVVSSNGEQYVLTGVSGDGSASSFTVTGAVAVTGAYKTQYYLAVSSAYGAVSGGGWYDFGSSAYASVNSLTAAGASGTQYVFTNWSGDATGTASPSNPIIMNGAKTATADWKTQYYLTASSAHGSIDGSGWYDSGLTAYVSLTAGTVSGGAGTQYVFNGWGTDAFGTNFAQSNPITMNGPKTATADWKTQYYLTVTSAHGTVGGGSWYNSDSSAYATITSLTAAGDSGTRYIFTGWSSDASGANSASNVIVMNGPKTASANWKTQYYINVTSAQGDPTPSTWIDAGQDFSVSVNSPAGTVPDDHRFVCTGCSVDGGTPKVENSYEFTSLEAAHTIVFDWKLQFWVAFNPEGLPKSLTANVTVNSVTHSLPYADWFDQGATVEYVYDKQLTSGFSTQYELSSTPNTSPLTVESSSNLDINCVRHYTIEMYIVVAVPIVLGCLVASIILVRWNTEKSRRKNI